LKFLEIKDFVSLLPPRNNLAVIPHLVAQHLHSTLPWDPQTLGPEASVPPANRQTLSFTATLLLGLRHRLAVWKHNNDKQRTNQIKTNTKHFSKILC